MTTLKEVLKNKECPCEIGWYIQHKFYDVEGNDAGCEFCDSNDLKLESEPAKYHDMNGNPVNVDIEN